ncbi:MAG: thiamine pyrophosphate-dependent enzyme, partial [Rhodospirillales bacterium]|nr:thiamine pyrophosphate-dependent enzyme [Rhodospirillales bacterium]
LYDRYRADPASVDASWVSLFQELGAEGGDLTDPLGGASWAPSRTRVIGQGEPDSKKAQAGPTASEDDLREATRGAIKARIMIRSFRVRGHLLAEFDPLGLVGEGYNKDLDPATYGFGEDDMDRSFFVGYVAGHDTLTLSQLLQILKSSYCSSIGIEYMHIQELDERIWMEDHIEGVDYHAAFTPEEKITIYRQLVEADGFETFLNIKHKGTKRFGLDGGESMIPAVEAILHSASLAGVEEIVLGMPHRGRLNVLATTMDKPYAAIFSEFQGASSNPEDVQGSGDVKYHLGASADREIDGNNLHLSLTANPSHLEAANPVVLGKVRAKQTQIGDEEREKVMGLLMHGDAAFAGQGLVPESLDLSQIKGYRTGGTLHIIVNNQIGFTTNPASSRFTPYPTDIAKGLQMPIFHVNGDDPEAVVHVSRLAMEYRKTFHRDVVIDMFCYRRHGHNEGDEPMFTQPIMYKAIAEHPTTRQIYEDKLIAEGVLTQTEAGKIKDEFQSQMSQDFEAGPKYKPKQADWLEGVWEGLGELKGEEEHQDYDTAVEIDTLLALGQGLAKAPKGFNINGKILRQLKARDEMM